MSTNHHQRTSTGGLEQPKDFEKRCDAYVSRLTILGELVPQCFFAAQVEAAEAPHSAAVVRLQSAQALERVCVQEHLKKKEAADHLESKLEALVVRTHGELPLFM